MAQKANNAPNAPAQDDSENRSVGIWMPWFIKDHRAAASTLSHIEHSALCYLNMLFWEHGGSLPNDDKFLARHLRLAPKQWKDMRDMILHSCTIAGGAISHPAIIAEVAKARLNVEQKRKAGMASAAARKAQRDGNGCSTAVATDGQRTGNGSATARQPRAGGGGGDGHYPYQDSSYSEVVEAKPFRVVEGGGK